jgi:hypothetical protein
MIYGQQDVRQLVSSLQMTDDEYLEVQKIISNEIDLNKEYHWQSKEYQHKYQVFETALMIPFRRWQHASHPEDIISNKLAPVIVSDQINDGLCVRWIELLQDEFVRNVKTDRIVPLFDYLFTIVNDEHRLLRLRIDAAEALISDEMRADRQQRLIEYLISKKELFIPIYSGSLIGWYLNTPQGMTDNALCYALLHHSKYAPEVINAIFDWYTRGLDTGEPMPNEDISIVEKTVATILNNKNEPDTKFMERSAQMSKRIKEGYSEPYECGN